MTTVIEFRARRSDAAVCSRARASAHPTIYRASPPLGAEIILLPLARLTRREQRRKPVRPRSSLCQAVLGPA
jgi:hypothetical protein